MGARGGGDLRAVGDDQDLPAGRKARQANADRRGDGAADPLIDFVKDDDARSAAVCERAFERQGDPRQLPARRRLMQGRERRARIGRDFKGDTIGPAGPAAVRPQIRERDTKPRVPELEGRKLDGNRRFEPPGRNAPGRAQGFRR